MANSSNAKKTHSRPKKPTTTTTTTTPAVPGAQIADQRHGSRQNLASKSTHELQNTAKGSSTKSKSTSAKKHTVNSNKFVINDQKKKSRSSKKIKIGHGWLLLLLIGAAGIGIAVVMTAKFFQSSRTTSPSGSDVSVSSTISKPKTTDDSPKKVSALAQAQSRVESVRTTLDQAVFSSNTIVKLKVPLYKQTYGQSCEASALRMALAYRGIMTTDMAILDQMGYDGQIAKTVKGRLIWGDPHGHYVGEKDGDQTDLTGYGVFGEPVVAAAEKNNRTAEVRDNVKIDWIVQQLYAGNPVILWGVSIKIDDGVWQTTDGKTITAPRRTHTRLVVGFSGDPKAPTGFYVNDPATGVEKFWKTAALETNISQGIKQAVVVY